MRREKFAEMDSQPAAPPPHLALWVDHCQARLIWLYRDHMVETLVRNPDAGAHGHVHHHRGTQGDGHAPVDPRFLEKISEAIGAAEPPPLTDRADQAVYEFARQLLESGDVELAVHAAVVAEWGEPGVVELTAVIGYYSMVSMMLSAQGIPTPSGKLPLGAAGPEGWPTRLPKVRDTALAPPRRRSGN